MLSIKWIGLTVLAFSQLCDRALLIFFYTK